MWRTLIRKWSIAGLLPVMAALAGCASSSPGSTIPTQDAALVGLGETLYEANCAECHGADLRGTDRGPSHLSQVYEPGHHSDDAFWLAVLQGSRQHHWRFGDMEPISGLSRQDVDAIVAFVRERQRIDGFEPYPP